MKDLGGDGSMEGDWFRGEENRFGGIKESPYIK